MARTTMRWLDLSRYGLALAIGALNDEPQPVVLGAQGALDRHGDALRSLGFAARGKHMFLPAMTDLPSLDTWKEVFPEVALRVDTPGREIAKDKVSARFMVTSGWMDPEAFKRAPEPDTAKPQAGEKPKDTLRWLDLSAYGLTIAYHTVGEDGILGGDGEPRAVVQGSEITEKALARTFADLGAELHLDRPHESHARITFNAGFGPETLGAIQKALPASKVADLPRNAVVRESADNPFAEWEPLNQIDWSAYSNNLASHVLKELRNPEPQPFTEEWLRDNMAEFSGVPRELVTREAGVSGRHVQETAEAATVRAFRILTQQEQPIAERVAQASRIDGMMPKASVRSGSSMLLQQYSTPLAISAVLQDILAINGATTVWEPTAGNGSLVSMASPAKVRGCEIDSDRLRRLHDQGFEGIQHADALRVAVPDGEYDRVIMNPPFGSFPDGKGGREFTSFVPMQEGGSTYPKLVTTHQDQLIALRHLQAMNREGLGAIIVGADHPMECDPGDYSEDTAKFLRMLYDTHDVLDVHYVDGKLYKSHGAGWPLLLIVTGGRRQAVEEADPPEKLPVIASTDDLLAYHSKVEEMAQQWRRDIDEPRRRREGDGERPPEVGEDAPTSEEDKEQNPTNETPAISPEEEEEAVEQVFEESQAVDDDDFDDFDGLDGDESIESRHAVEDAEVAYEPRSRMRSLEKRIPANLAAPVSRALDTVQLHHGDIDLFVAEELGWTLDELEDRLAAEQVDAVSLAMHQGELSRGFILGDNTGIGKGRVLATLLAWGIKHGNKPIFVTSKAGLFSDIMRDLNDIGEADIINPLVMNDIPEIRGVDGSVVLRNTPSKTVNPLIKERSIGKDHNCVFMTYSQVNREMGKCPKAQWLSVVAEDNVLLLDEIHNAAGPDSNTGANIVQAIRGAKFVMGSSGTYAKRPDNLGLYVFTSMFDGSDPETLIGTVATGGTEYQEVLSTMLAESGQMIVRSHKAAPPPEPLLLHPEYGGLGAREIADRLSVVLDALTGLSEGATEIVNEDNEAIRQIIEAMPAGEQGKYAHWKSRTLNFGSVMHNVVRQALFALKCQGVVDEVERSINEGRRVVVGIDNTMESFLSSVAKEIAAEHAKAAEGEAPASEIPDGGDLVDLFSAGAPESESIPANISYRDTIVRLLDRLILIEETDRYGKTTSSPAFSVAEMRKDWEDGSLMERMATDAKRKYDDLAWLYFEAEELIKELPEDIPASPIDYIRNELGKRGIESGEITGREITIDYSDEEKGPVFSKRTPEDRDRLRAAENFNHKNTKVLFVNSSGAEGVSLHGHKDFTNNEDRELLFAQIPYDIATYNQLAGRIDRSGAREGYVPRYKLLGLDLPAEKRQMANLIRKDSSLKANTRADREGRVQMYGVPMMNRVGDQVAYEVLRDYPDSDSICDRLGININSEGDKFSQTSLKSGIGNDTGLYSKVMSRLSRMKLCDAEPIVEAMEDLYQQRIEILDQAGNNPMKTKIFDLKAEFTDEVYEIVPKSGPSSFQAAVEARQIRYNEDVKPIAFEVVDAAIERTRDKLKKVGMGEMPIQGKWKDIDKKQITELRRHAANRLPTLFAELEKTSDNPEAAFADAVMKASKPLTSKPEDMETLKSLIKRHRMMQHFRDTLGVGVKVSDVPLDILSAEDLEGKADFVITGIKVPKPTENPAAPSNWEIVMMSPDGSAGAVKMSLSQLMNFVSENPEIRMAGEPLTEGALRRMFHDDRPAYTEERKQMVLMGNLFAAASSAKNAQEANAGLGRPLPAVFTDSQGVKHRGILMPRWFEVGDLELLKDVDFTVSKHDVAMAYLDHLVKHASDTGRKVALYSTHAWYSLMGARSSDKPDALGSGVRLVQDPDTRQWAVDISRRRKDNIDYLKDGVLLEMMDGEFESSKDVQDRNMMRATLRSNALLPDLIERLMTHHRMSFHGSHHDSEWHREFLRVRGQRLEEEEKELKEMLGSQGADPDEKPASAQVLSPGAQGMGRVAAPMPTPGV